ncbi:MAG: sugar ABC transporter ATP-binding protein [Lawsonibacter sp.]|jgi:ABC-type sugar transport system ATPase subunit|nr:sugar ABC transporter ATP-binding protein [Lawsonibacter sp.]
MGEPILEVRGITKLFPGVRALDKVHLELREGEVVCLVGENGAGKSTLIKILSGVYTPDEGEIILNGQQVHFKGPLDAIKAGFSVVYQEHKLMKNLSVAENIYFGRFPMKAGGFVDFRKLNQDTQRILDDLGMHIKPTARVETLNSSQSQMVEIAKAYSVGTRIMILDEPSASITDSELLKLFEIINKLKKQGKSFIYISHRLKELFEIGDRVVVFKDGHYVGQEDIGNVTVDKLVSMMVGRDIGKVYRPKDRPVGQEVLRVEGLCNDVVTDCSFTVHAGEIVGFAGLVGSGRSELMESLFGYRRKSAGTVTIGGRQVEIKKPKDAIRSGLGFVTEDRKTTGLILNKSVGFNTSFAILDKLSCLGFVDRKEEAKLVDQSIQQLSVKTPGPKQEAGNLSGGNQQKVILSKWLLAQPQLLICDEPTKGIDVGTKQEFYNILDDLARQGKAIIVVSSELPEVIGLSNRIYVMSGGRIVKELAESEMDEETIASYSMKE